MTIRHLRAALLVAAMLAMIPGAAAQAQKPIPRHPRVNQVNRRFNKQAARVHQGVKNGTLTRHQANQLHRERKTLKTEEHAMRRSNHGHLTKADQRALNQQLNRRSHQIYHKKHH